MLPSLMRMPVRYRQAAVGVEVGVQQCGGAGRHSSSLPVSLTAGALLQRAFRQRAFSARRLEYLAGTAADEGAGGGGRAGKEGDALQINAGASVASDQQAVRHWTCVSPTHSACVGATRCVYSLFKHTHSLSRLRVPTTSCARNWA